MSSTDAAEAAIVSPPAPRAPRKKMTKIEMLQKRVKEDPAVFGFLGLTVVALTGGLVSLIRNNRKQSQMMMRARVFFQFCAISSLVGGVYYRTYAGKKKDVKPMSTDKRTYLTDPMPALEEVTQQGGDNVEIDLAPATPQLR